MDAASRRLVRSVVSFLVENYGDAPVPTGRETFAGKEIKELEKTHFIVELQGESLGQLKAKNSNEKIAIWTSESLTAADLDAPSRVGQIAIAKELFLPNSGSKLYDEQKAMVEAHGARIQTRPGLSNVIEVVGQVGDYAGVVREVQKRYKKELFGSEYDYNYTVALRAAGLAIVGSLNDSKLHVGGWKPDARNGSVLVAPLVVPA